MVNFYVKNDSGEFVEPTEQQIDEFYKTKSERIIARKLADERDKFRAKIDEELRKEVSEKIKAEARKEVEAEYQQKVSEAESRVQDLDIQLRRKKIANEYGFKPEAEDFLGNGTDDEMRAKADVLKNGFSSEPSSKGLKKQSTEPTTSGCVKLVNTES